MERPGGIPLTVGEIVVQIVRVFHRNVAHSERGLTRAKVNFHGIFVGGNHPEETVCGYPRTVVMNLYQRVGDAYRTGGVDIESNEDEGTMVVFAVLPHIYALHSSHVSPKRDRRSQSGTGAQPTDLGVNDLTVEITDF